MDTNAMCKFYPNGTVYKKDMKEGTLCYSQIFTSSQNTGRVLPWGKPVIREKRRPFPPVHQPQELYKSVDMLHPCRHVGKG